MKACLIVFVLAASLGGCVLRPSSETLVRKPYISHVDKSQREYFVYLPRGYSNQPDKQWPVMLFLHGNGERGNGRDELDYVLCHGPLYEAWIRKKDLPFIIISPQLHMFGMETRPYIANRTRAQIPQRLKEGVPARPAPFPTPRPMAAGVEIKNMAKVPPLLPMGWEKVEEDLLDMVALVQQEYRTDLKRLYITGLSYGGFGTWYMASKHPSLFAAVVPVVGWGHPSLMPPIAKAGLPVWAFAGGRDNTIEKKYFYAGINKLESLSEADIRFTVEEDMGHDAWTRVYASDDLYSWMLSHSKP